MGFLLETWRKLRREKKASPEQGPLIHVLTAVLEAQREDPHSVEANLSRLQSADLVGFSISACSLLLSMEETNAWRALYRQTTDQRTWPRVLSIPAALTLPMAADLADATRRDGQLPATDLFAVADELWHAPGTAADKRIQRILSIVRSVWGDERAMPWLLARMESDPEPSRRSKAALLLNRTFQKPEVVKRQMLDPDARVRANAIEGMIGCDSPEAIEVYRSVLDDPAPRVVCNALVGLYEHDAQFALDKLQGLCSHSSEEFRASTAWAIGEIGNDAARPWLTRLAQDESPMVRKIAVKSLLRLRQRQSGAA